MFTNLITNLFWALKSFIILLICDNQNTERKFIYDGEPSNKMGS
jgi:hypothetical protein